MTLTKLSGLFMGVLFFAGVFVLPNAALAFSCSTVSRAQASDLSFGRSTGGFVEAIPFQITSGTCAMASILLNIKKVGTPDGTVTFNIYNDSAGSPGSVIFTSDTIAPASIATSYGDITANISGTLNTGTTYWLAALTSGTPSNTNFYQTAGTSASGTCDGTGNAKYSDTPVIVWLDDGARCFSHYDITGNSPATGGPAVAGTLILLGDWF